MHRSEKLLRGLRCIRGKFNTQSTSDWKVIPQKHDLTKKSKKTSQNTRHSSEEEI